MPRRLRHHRLRKYSSSVIAVYSDSISTGHTSWAWFLGSHPLLDRDGIGMLGRVRGSMDGYEPRRTAAHRPAVQLLTKPTVRKRVRAIRWPRTKT